MDHATQHAGGVFDRLATAEVNVICAEEQRFATKFTDADLEGNTGARGGLGEDQGPGLTGERLMLAAGSLTLENGTVRQDVIDVRRGHFFQTEKVFHGELISDQ